MNLIAFLAPDEEMLSIARAMLERAHPDVLLEQGLLSAGVRKARTLAREGVEIVITRGRKEEAAKLLGISRSTLWRRMKSLGLS